jgi:hypothetical protein
VPEDNSWLRRLRRVIVGEGSNPGAGLRVLGEEWTADPADPDAALRWEGPGRTQSRRLDRRCLVLTGLFEPGMVVGEIPDGTYVIALDGSAMPPPFNRVYGVPKSQVLFGEYARWGAIFDELAAGRPGLDAAAFKQAMVRCAGIDPQLVEPLDELYQFICRKVFQWEDGQPVDLLLDRRQSFDLLVGGGFAPSGAGMPVPRYHEAYWKMLSGTFRIGGREPDELSRVITLSDAATALGVSTGSSPSAVSELNALQGVSIPPDLAWLWSDAVQKALNAVLPYRWFPIAPGADDEPGSEEWPVLSDREGSADQFTIPFMHVDGVIWWAAAFQPGDAQARVILADEESPAWHVAAPSLAHFVWDVVQTGLGWHSNPDTRSRSVRTVRTDIGQRVL